jgi:hypothetical protein
MTKTILHKGDFLIVVNTHDENEIREFNVPIPFEYATLATVPIFARKKLSGD